MLAPLIHRYRHLGPFEKFGVWAGAASILGLLVGVLTLRPPFLGTSESNLLVQTGNIEAVSRADVSDPTYDVYYPVPYVSPPELTWLNSPYRLRVLEQRADGFRVQFGGSYWGTGSPTWQAKGIRKWER